MQIKTFFDPRTFTLTYLVWDPATRDAVVIDPVLDFDPASGKVWTESADVVADFAEAEGLSVHYSLETHAHADHLSGGQIFADRFGAKVAIGSGIRAVQEVFGPVFAKGPDFPTDGSQFDVLVEHGQSLVAGSLTVQTIHTPGHTPACVTWHIEDAVFTGDALFMPDFGTGRCDFPAGSAEDLYDSVTKRLYTLPDATRVFVGHDYQPGGRALEFETTIGASRTDNEHLKADTPLQEFVEFRTTRDASLAPPALIFQSLQVNARAGKLPEPDEKGRRMLRMPMGVFS